jgi:23S rRNA (adenine2030-N6)-methyltransferase
MLSYQHAYHAGNPADILKHALWAQVLHALVQKPKPLKVYESHAGRGVYPLTDPAMAKGAEWQHGISKLDLKKLNGPYGATLRALNPKTLELVPGSPAVATQVLRATDDLHLCELHPAERTHLYRWARPHANVHIHDTDGLVQVPALLRQGQREAVLIDPSYEQVNDYATTLACAQACLKKNPNAVVAVWLPLLNTGKGQGKHQGVIDGIKALGIDATWLAVWRWSDKQFPSFALGGSAMVVTNLPFGLEKTLTTQLTALAAMLKLPRTAQTYTMVTARQ